MDAPAPPWLRPFLRLLEAKDDDVEPVGRLLDAAPPGPVLDLAGGFGRLAVVAARCGREVLVVDSDPHVLAHAREYLRAEPASVVGRIAWERADVREPLPPPEEPYALVLLAFNALNEVVDGLDAVMANACAHLARGGAVFLDTVLEAECGRAGQVKPAGTVDDAGTRWVVHDLVVPTGERRHDLVLLYEREGEGERLRQTIPRRVWSLAEIERAAAPYGVRVTGRTPPLVLRQP